MHMYIRKGNGVLFDCVLCCGMIVYQQIVLDSIPVPSTECVSAPSFELHKPEYRLSCGATD